MFVRLYACVCVCFVGYVYNDVCEYDLCCVGFRMCVVVRCGLICVCVCGVGAIFMESYDSSVCLVDSGLVGGCVGAAAGRTKKQARSCNHWLLEYCSHKSLMNQEDFVSNYKFYLVRGNCRW